MSTSEIYHYVKVDERVITCGQPTVSQLRAAAADKRVSQRALAKIQSMLRAKEAELRKGENP